MSNDDRKLYIGGLPYKYTKDDLFDMFEKYGKVEDAFIILDKGSGRSRGFGFVIFENLDSCDEAISAMNDTDLDGRSLIVEFAGRRKSGGGGGGGYRRGGGGGYRGNYQRRDRDRDRDYGRGNYGDDRRYGGGGGRRGYDDRY